MFDPDKARELAETLEATGPHSCYPTDAECQEAGEQLRAAVQLSAERNIAVRAGQRALQDLDIAKGKLAQAQRDLAEARAEVAKLRGCTICGTLKQPPCRHTLAAGKETKT